MNYNIKILINYGVHIGHKEKYRSPYMDGYLIGNRKEIMLINIEQTIFMLKRAIKFIKKKKKKLIKHEGG